MRPPIEDWCHSLGFLTKSEFSLPWGICDLVGVRFRQRNALQRKASKLIRPVGSLELLQLLELIPDSKTGHAITIERLKRLLANSRSPDQVHADIRRLGHKRLVHFPRRNHVQKNAAWQPLHGKILAVEMKLRRVKVALAQARSHLAFADESYVALPGNVAELVASSERRLEFLCHGVGLLAARPDGVQVLISGTKARRTEFGNLFRHQCAERFWKMWLINSAS